MHACTRSRRAEFASKCTLKTLLPAGSLHAVSLARRARAHLKCCAALGILSSLSASICRYWPSLCPARSRTCMLCPPSLTNWRRGGTASWWGPGPPFLAGTGLLGSAHVPVVRDTDSRLRAAAASRAGLGRCAAGHPRERPARAGEGELHAPASPHLRLCLQQAGARSRWACTQWRAGHTRMCCSVLTLVPSLLSGSC